MPLFNFLTMPIKEVTQNNFSKAISLLKQNNLPTEDISEVTKLFSIVDVDKVIATIGVEFYKNICLLRSFAVNREYRSKGIGKQLVNFIEDFAKQKRMQEIVLLTTTASDYFAKRNYQIIHREDIPDEIKNSSEFRSTCPSSAIVMKKVLQPPAKSTGS